jgi:hypothetical protein
MRWVFSKKSGRYEAAPDAKPKAAPAMGPVEKTIIGAGVVPCVWLVNPKGRTRVLVRLDTFARVKDVGPKKATSTQVRLARQVKLPGTEREHRFIDRETLAMLVRQRRAARKARVA